MRFQAIRKIKAVPTIKHRRHKPRADKGKTRGAYLSGNTLKICNLLRDGLKDSEIAKTVGCTRQNVSFVRHKYLVHFPDKR